MVPALHLGLIMGQHILSMHSQVWPHSHFFEIYHGSSTPVAVEAFLKAKFVTLDNYGDFSLQYKMFNSRPIESCLETHVATFTYPVFCDSD